MTYDYIVYCPYCNKQAVWINNQVIYGKRYGKSYMVWLCKNCDAYVGCHNNTREPLGTLANKELRLKRMELHGIIDKYWQSGKFTRGRVYRKLSQYYGMSFHTALLSMAQCRRVYKDLKKFGDRIIK